jgi:predicted nucleotidyltransferase
MHKYLVLYRSEAALSGMTVSEMFASSTPEQMKAGMGAWRAWHQKCGSAVVDLGAPLDKSITVAGGAGTPSKTSITGYTFLQAGSVEEAVSLMKITRTSRCPAPRCRFSSVLRCPGCENRTPAGRLAGLSSAMCSRTASTSMNASAGASTLCPPTLSAPSAWPSWAWVACGQELCKIGSMERDHVLAALKAHEQELRTAGVESASLFGSVARGEDSANDVDVAVRLGESFSAPGLRYFSRLSELEGQLSDILGCKVDVIEEPVRKKRFQTEIDRDRAIAF